MIGPRLVDKPLVLYGKGKLGHLAKEIFDRLDIEVIEWIDNESCVVNDSRRRWRLLVANAVALYPPSEIESYLWKQGYRDIVPVWDIIEAYLECGIHNGWFAPIQNMRDNACVLGVRSQLCDEESKLMYQQFCEYRIGRIHYTRISEKEGSDLECLPSTLQDILMRRQFPLHVYKDNWILHSEGNEMGLLFGSINKIIEDRPTLKVACYHNEDGLWRIPYFLMTRLENYRFEFMMYAYQGQAAFLYCYPNEMTLR